jgi:hypothetical protein
MKKYEYLVLFVSIINNKYLKLVFSNNHFLYNYLFKSFRNVCIVDVNNLTILKKKNNLDVKILKDFFPNSNIKFLSSNNFIQFHRFLRNKKIVGIKSFGTSYGELIINIFLKFYDVKLLEINNIGNENSAYSLSQHKIKVLKNFLVKKLSHKLTVFLSMIGLVRKIDIRFISNSRYLKYNKINTVNKVANLFNLPYVKKLIPINSRAYDIFLNEKHEIKNDYITVMDEQLNEPQWAKWRNLIEKKDITLHYKKFNSYLKKLSIALNKKVIICIHPNDNLNEKKKLFKNFKVLKYKTREYIYKSYLVVFFESSAIIDAVLLNKNITTIHSKIMDENQIASGLHYVRELKVSISNIDNIKNLNLTKKFLVKNKIIKNSIQIKKDYKNYIKKYISTDVKNVLGVEKIKKIIKQRYKLD